MGGIALNKLLSWILAAIKEKAAASHKHAAGDITSGTLPVARGGTGATSAAGALSTLGAAATGHKHAAGDITSGTLPVARGGTGATSAAAARTNLEAAAASHTHAYLPLSGGTMTGRILAKDGATGGIMFPATKAEAVDKKVWGIYYDAPSDVFHAGSKSSTYGSNLSVLSAIKQASLETSDEDAYDLIEKGEDGYYALAYDEFIPLAVQAVQSLQKEVSELKEKLNTNTYT